MNEATRSLHLALCTIVLVDLIGFLSATYGRQMVICSVKSKGPSSIVRAYAQTKGLSVLIRAIWKSNQKQKNRRTLGETLKAMKSWHAQTMNSHVTRLTSNAFQRNYCGTARSHTQNTCCPPINEHFAQRSSPVASQPASLPVVGVDTYQL